MVKDVVDRNLLLNPNFWIGIQDNIMYIYRSRIDNVTSTNKEKDDLSDWIHELMYEVLSDNPPAYYRISIKIYVEMLREMKYHGKNIWNILRMTGMK